MVKRIVLKVGTSTLTGGTSRISRGKIEDIASQINALRADYQIILVTSGAIAAAKQFSNLKMDDNVAIKQALASIGQLQLMRIYQEIFRDYNLQMAQCLLTYFDFKNVESRTNMRNTIDTLLANDYIPVINENDTVATDEIKFGDNDKLAALTAELMEADLLVLATDTDGVYNADPKKNSNAEIIPEIKDVNEIKLFLSDSKSDQGSGGMKSKIEAAEIAQSAGIETWVTNGGIDDFLLKAINGSTLYTRII